MSSAALAGVGVAGGATLLSACGGGSSGGPGGNSNNGGQAGSGDVTWGSWANPGEAERFRAFNKDYEAKTDANVTWQNVVGDYPSKMLVQLQGGTAPDAFYVGDTLIAKAIDAKTLVNLKTNPEANALHEATYPGLAKWTTSADGGVYGITVDCNPKVFWFNKKLLADAGVNEDPAALFAAGTWTIEAATEMLSKVTASGKRGLSFEPGYGDLFSWITTFGGKVFDDQDKKAIFDEDENAQKAIKWIFDQFANGNLAYTGTLPKGQSYDALFYSGQLACMTPGRWVLPNLKKLKGSVEYNIAPIPSVSGKDVMPVVVFTACMSVNEKAKDPEAALKFLTAYCGKEGQKFRLAGGGNAVPSIAGLDEIVTEGNDPENGKVFTEVAAKGYAVPLPLIRSAKKSADLPLKLDSLYKDIKNQTPETFSKTLVKLLNG